MADFHLDCKGQRCPKPIVQIAQKMAQMSSGQTLRVEATDGAFRLDVLAWVAMRNEELLELDTTGLSAIAVLAKR